MQSHPGMYGRLVSHAPDPIDLEIMRDLNRTFPNHVFFHQRQGPGQQSLFHVLRAYSALDKQVSADAGGCAGRVAVYLCVLCWVISQFELYVGVAWASSAPRRLPRLWPFHCSCLSCTSPCCLLARSAASEYDSLSLVPNLLHPQHFQQMCRHSSLHRLGTCRAWALCLPSC